MNEEASAHRKLFAIVGELRERIDKLETRCEKIERDTGDGLFLLGQLVGLIAIKSANGDREWLEQIVQHIKLDFAMKGIDPEPYLNSVTLAFEVDQEEGS